jgi:tetratricopeptide (TPR) repeat protein
MAKLVVQFPGMAMVTVDGVVRGETNRVIPLAPGSHVVALQDVASDPERHVVDAKPDPNEVLRVGFSVADRPIERFSPLYCRYNGFVLGQFLTLFFAEYAREKYGERRARMLEFLNEIGAAVALPEQPPDLGGEGHVALIESVLPRIAERSGELSHFVLLGSLLTHHGLLEKTDPEMARQSREQIEGIREQYGLPAVDFDATRADPETGKVDAVLSPSLAYLNSCIAALPVEKDTAFVIMPFRPPYSGYFAQFYRPALEQAGYRAFRAWGGLSNEDYCDLLLELIRKVGLVWADVSELNFNVLYEIGAAHALGKPSMLVVREEDAERIPANIGHDAVVRYSTSSEDWPKGTVLLMTALISMLTSAAEHGKRMRVTPEALGDVLDAVGRQLRELVVPPEAKEAVRLGREKNDTGDFAGAEACFDDAIRLGLDDAMTMLGRGMARLCLQKPAEAEADLTMALAQMADAPVAKEIEAGAAYIRGMARENQESFAGAREDYGRAIELGYPDPEVRRRRAAVSLRLDDLADARAHFKAAREQAPEDADTLSLEGDLRLAEGRYTEAVAAYDRAIAVQPGAEAELSRALALLCAGRAEEALDGYRRGAKTATPGELEWALRDLERRAHARAGAKDCRAILVAARGKASPTPTGSRT